MWRTWRTTLLTLLVLLLVCGQQGIVVAQMQPRSTHQELRREAAERIRRASSQTQNAPVYWINAEQPWLAAGPNGPASSSDLWTTTIAYHNLSTQQALCGFVMADDSGLYMYDVSAIDASNSQVLVGNGYYSVAVGQDLTFVLLSRGGQSLLGQVQLACGGLDPSALSQITGTYAFSLFSANSAIKTESSYAMTFTVPSVDSDFVVPRYKSWNIACHTGTRKNVVGTGSATNSDVCGIGVALTCSQAQCPNPVQISFTPLDKMGHAVGTRTLAFRTRRSTRPRLARSRAMCYRPICLVVSSATPIRFWCNRSAQRPTADRTAFTL